MRHRPARKLRTQAIDDEASALTRARRARKKGKTRQEVNSLRQACSMREFDAALWTRLGDAWLRMSRNDEAAAAFKHALWLREKAGDTKRATVTRRLLASVWGGVLTDRAA